MEIYAAMCDVCVSETHFLFVKLVQEFRLKMSLYWRSALKIACQSQCSTSYCPLKEIHLRFAEKKYIHVLNFVFPPVISCIKNPLSDWGHNLNVKYDASVAGNVDGNSNYTGRSKSHCGVATTTAINRVRPGKTDSVVMQLHSSQY
jgi:hypothetical protein